METSEQSRIRKFYIEFLGKLNNLKDVSISFCLNDNGDVLIRMKPTDSHLRKVLG